MAIETKIVVHDYSVHPETGHIRLSLRTESVDGNHKWYGPIAGYGTDPKMLQTRFHGSIDEFEQWAKTEHAPFIGAHPGLQEELSKRKGRAL